MFVVDGEGDPGDAPGLAAALAAGLGPALAEGSPAASVEAEGWPELATLSVDLTGCALSGGPSPFVSATDGDRRDGPTAKLVSIVGRNVSIGGAASELSIEATNADFSYGTAEDGRTVLALDRIDDGALEFFVAEDEIAERLREGLDARVSKQNARVLAVEIDTSAQGENGVFVTLLVTVKMMFKAKIRVTGVLLLSDTLVLTVDQAFAKGVGMAGKMVAGLVAPQLKALEGKDFPLGVLLPAGVGLTDVALRTEGGLGATARLAAPPE
jgi:hypothetical protein